MKINIIETLDDLISFVMSDKYLAYNLSQIHFLINAMNEKVSDIDDIDEKDFYKSVVEEITSEMLEVFQNEQQREKTNTIGIKYDLVLNKIKYDLNNSIKRGDLIKNQYKISFKKTPDKCRTKFYIHNRPFLNNVRSTSKRDISSIIDSLNSSVTDIVCTELARNNTRKFGRSKRIFTQKRKLIR